MHRTGPILLAVGVAFCLSGGWWLLSRQPDCRPDGALVLAVGAITYHVPAWTAPYPGESRLPRGLERSSIAQRRRGFSTLCQSRAVPVVHTRGFGFQARPAAQKSHFPVNTPRIVRADGLPPAYRPGGTPIEWRSTRSVSYAPEQVDADRGSASIAFTLHLASGRTRILRADCQWGVHTTAHLRGRDYLQRCRTAVPLPGGNVLEINVNPGEDRTALGAELIRALQVVERMSARTRSAYVPGHLHGRASAAATGLPSRSKPIDTPLRADRPAAWLASQ